MRHQGRKQLTHYQAVGNPRPMTLAGEIINSKKKKKNHRFIIIILFFIFSLFEGSYPVVFVWLEAKTTRRVGFYVHLKKKKRSHLPQACLCCIQGSISPFQMTLKQHVKRRLYTLKDYTSPTPTNSFKSVLAFFFFFCFSVLNFISRL